MVRVRTYIPTCKDNKKKPHVKTFILTNFSSNIPHPLPSSQLSPFLLFITPFLTSISRFFCRSKLAWDMPSDKEVAKGNPQSGRGGITPPLFIGEMSKGRRGSKIINNNFSTFIPFIFLYKYSQCVHPISSQAKNLDSEASRLPRSSRKTILTKNPEYQVFPEYPHKNTPFNIPLFN